MIYPEKLAGKLVSLRTIEETDAEYTYRIRQDKEKTKYLHEVNGTVEDQRQWIRKSRDSADEYTFLVEDKQEKPLGMYGLYHVHGDEAEIGRALMFGNSIQDSEAAVLLHDFAFYVCKIKTLHVDIFMENKPSIGMTLRLGGKEVGRCFDGEFNMTNIEYLITLETYEPCREKVTKLIERFSSRV